MTRRKLDTTLGGLHVIFDGSDYSFNVEVAVEGRRVQLSSSSMRGLTGKYNKLTETPPVKHIIIKSPWSPCYAESQEAEIVWRGKTPYMLMDSGKFKSIGGWRIYPHSDGVWVKMSTILEDHEKLEEKWVKLLGELSEAELK